MVTAFAATVIGLTISMTAYLIAATRESWVRADSPALAFQAEWVLCRTGNLKFEISNLKSQITRFVHRHRLSAPGPAPGQDEDPLAGIANVFDVSIAFIVASLIALFALFSSDKVLDKKSNVTQVKQTENREMEIITKQGAHIKVQKGTDRTLSGQGTRLGTACRLANGQVVFVPDDEAKPK